MIRLLIIILILSVLSCATKVAMKNCNYAYEERTAGVLIKTDDSVCEKKTIFGSISLW